MKTRNVRKVKRVWCKVNFEQFPSQRTENRDDVTIYENALIIGRHDLDFRLKTAWEAINCHFEVVVVVVRTCLNSKINYVSIGNCSSDNIFYQQNTNIPAERGPSPNHQCQEP